jgi:hypothetical protein
MVQRAGGDQCLAQLDDFGSARLGITAQTVNKGRKQRADSNRVGDKARARHALENSKKSSPRAFK